jgi:hypothetical protein
VALVRSKPAAISQAMALPVVAPPPHALPVTRPAVPMAPPAPANGTYLRRCTFRRIAVATPAGRRSAASYAVTCVYPDLGSGSPLGDLQSARAICDGCGATGIFRPDED